MTSRFERRLSRIEKLQQPVPEPPPDPRMFVIATLVGFHCCDRRDDEHPLQAYSAAAKGPDGQPGMHKARDADVRQGQPHGRLMLTVLGDLAEFAL
jgi:hypothetical protein